MKKKILIVICLLFMFATGVASASAWGKFEGYNIVRLLINGKEANVKDVPAVMLNNRTMVPIYLLRDAGLNVSWDGKTSTVNVENKSFVSKEEFIEMNKVIQTHRAFIAFMDQIELVSISRDILMSVTNKEQFEKAMDTVNRIDIDGLYGWADILYYLDVKENNLFYSVSDSIEKSKHFLLNGDVNNAFDYYISAKTTMNKIFPTMDYKVETTFSPKNRELFE